ASTAFTHAPTGAKALYQVHRVPGGEAPRSTDFERTISLLDNAQLATGLQVTANYLRSLAAQQLDPRVNPQDRQALANRIDAALGQFNCRIWFDNQSQNVHIGGPENPLLGSSLDRITSEARLAPVVALAR